jgi:hypothetical protein
MGLNIKTYGLTDCQSQCNSDFGEKYKSLKLGGGLAYDRSND